MMTDWYQKSINTLQLNGKAERTQEAYTRAVRMLSAFYGKSPDEITEAELEAYFLRRRNVDHWSANVRCSSCGRVYEPGAGLTERTITPERILAAAGIDDARQAEYQRKMSALLAGR